MENKLDRILSELDNLKQKVQVFEQSQQQGQHADIRALVKQVLEDNKTDQPSSQVSNNSATGCHCREGHLGPNQSAVSQTGFARADTDALQSAFRAVKDSVQNYKLPDDLYLGNRQGPVSKDLRELAAQTTSISKYVETGLKLSGKLCEGLRGQEVPDDLLDCADNLVLTLVAATRFLQEEQASIVVGSTLGPKTRQFFKSTGGNTSAFSNLRILDRVKVSAQLAALP